MFEVSVSFSRGDYVLINKLKPVGRIVERLKFPLRDYARLLARYYSLFVAHVSFRDFLYLNLAVQRELFSFRRVREKKEKRKSIKPIFRWMRL